MGDAERCRKLGISSYLVKPIRSDDLHRAVATLLSATVQAELPARLGDSTVYPAPGHPALSSLRVLLAEDNPVSQRVAERILAKRGIQVTVAGNGKEALAALAEANLAPRLISR